MAWGVQNSIPHRRPEPPRRDPRLLRGPGLAEAAAAAAPRGLVPHERRPDLSAGDLGGAVTEASAVGELRALVAKHYDSEPKRIRLVSRGNILRDDAQALGAAGVRPKDKLMVVVMKGATRFSKARK